MVLILFTVVQQPEHIPAHRFDVRGTAAFAPHFEHAREGGWGDNPRQAGRLGGSVVKKDGIIIAQGLN